MKRKEHKAAVRGKISSVARKLFLEQGYQNTKMRQIKEAAEVKMGTIYHFYKNKEDILEKIVMKAFFRVQERTESFTHGDKQLHLASELAWHVHTMAQHPPSAELYMISYNSPDIAAQLLINQIQRSKMIFGDRFPNLAEADYEVYAMSARGLMQSICLQAVRGTLTDPETIIRKSTILLLKMMDTPKEEIEQVLSNLQALQLAEKVAVALQ
jgi:AcrR family transcriptional regulator